MPFNVQEFRDFFSRHDDYAKTSKFDVYIADPPGLRGFQDLRFQCESTELPGVNFNTVENKIYGVPNPVASFITYSDITLNFLCAGDMWEKKLFDSWMQLIIPTNNYNPNYKSNYQTIIDIKQYNEISTNARASTPIYEARLWNAFPTALAPLSLNWSDDSVHHLAVTFRYEYWTTPRYNLNKLVVKDNGSTPPY